VGVLISGRGSNMESLVRAAADPGFPAEIRVVVSNRREAPGLAIARDLGVEAVVVDHRDFGRDRGAHERAVDAVLRARGVRVVCLAGYMRLLTPWFVAAWQGRMLNIHPSLLPALPGLDTHARAISAGLEEHGCTVHLVTDVMDAGPVLVQARVPVLAGDDAGGLASRVLAAEHRLYPAALREFLEGKKGLLF
jgi:formyltetrahydrofolate-dependent phosphoribosylglycinamide formyltransferase